MSKCQEGCVRNERIRVAQASKAITKKKKILKWYGHVMRMKEEHLVRQVLDVDMRRKIRRGRLNKVEQCLLVRQRNFFPGMGRFKL